MTYPLDKCMSSSGLEMGIMLVGYGSVGRYVRSVFGSLIGGVVMGM